MHRAPVASEGCDAHPGATMADDEWVTGRRLVIGLGVAVCASVLAVWVWWTAPHRQLADTLDDVRLPAGLVHLGDERQGDRTCFFDNCPRLVRYYGSDSAPDELCAVIEDEFPEVELDRLGSVCAVQLRGLSDYAAFLHVREPISEIPPENENELIESTPVDIPHRSVLYLSIRN